MTITPTTIYAAGATRRTLLRAGLSVLGLSALATTAACGSEEPKAPGTLIQVFASTSVWAAVAKAVGGDRVEVFAAIASPDQDPHDYEASAQDKLRASRSTVAVINGGGYDAWATSVLESVDPKPTVVDAFEAGKHAEGDNEHVFYSLHTALAVAGTTATTLKSVDAAHGSGYDTRLATFTDQIAALQKRAQEWAAQNKGTKVVSTESVAEYLVTLLGLSDVTPPEFVRQSESESGPSVAVIEKTRRLIGTTANVLVVNGQTEDAVSTSLVEQATKTGARIVKVYETFPPGVDDYLAFMTKAVDAITG